MASHKCLRNLLPVLVYLSHYNCFVSKAETDTIYYNLGDNTLENTFIGNIVNDAGLQMEFTSDVLSTLSYVFLNKDGFLQYFLLEEKIGNLKTSQLLDRDVVCPSQRVCQLEIDIAIQPSAYFRVIKVFISIADINDNAPRFKDRVISIELRESTQPGILTPLVPATDQDSPANGVKGYKLLDESNKFELRVQNNTDYSSLEVSLALRGTLDRELVQSHILKVIAFDEGQPARSGTVQIAVKVLDVNDNHPQFTQKTYNVEVNESYPLNKEIVQVHADDRDSGENGQVTYSFNPNTMRDGGDVFDLDPQTGSIKLKRQLDFEQKTSYSLTVVAQDGGIDSIPSNAKVLVSVLDVNDIAPRIIVNDLPDDGVLHITENLGEQTFVAHLTILDEEQGNNGKAECEVEQNQFFTLKLLYEKEYSIVSSQVIDREKHNQLLLRVICRDFGTPSLKTEVELVIKVDDENDNFPVFLQGMAEAQIEEGNSVGSKVTRVEARDADEGLNGEVRYFCEHDLFSINPADGVITAKTSFDREQQDVYYLNVMATDLGEDPKHNVTLLTITILDVDDNKPVFKEKLYAMNVTENADLHTYIGQVHAVDVDSYNYNKFYYFLIASSVSHKFTVDNRTGAIYTNYPFDRERTSQYKLEVMVQSDGSQDIQDRAIVTVDILDENDNTPIISFPSVDSSHITLSNQAPVGYKVAQVVSYDIDLGNNSVLSYQLSEQHDEYFYIDATTGNIYINKELWPLRDKNFTLKVLVSDYGFPQRKTSVATLYIMVNSSIAHIPADSLPNIESGVSVDVIAIVVGCLCAALITALVVVLCILVLLRRRRRKKQDAVHTWIRSEKPGCNNTFINRHFSGDGQEAVNREETSQVVITDTDPTQRSQTPPGTGDRDSDSGCFDLSHSDSHSSNETPQNTVAKIAVNKQPPAPTIVQTKCYHQHNHQPAQQPHTSTADVQQNNQPLSTFNPQPTYPAPSLSTTDSSVSPPPQAYNNLDFVQPHRSNSLGKPKPPPRFSDYLQTESQQLKQRGHVYNVSSHSLKPSNSVKKTVRFCEPETESNRSSSPRAVPNDYVSSSDVTRYKSGNQATHCDHSNNNSDNSPDNIATRDSNKNLYELADSDALHLNSLV